MPRSFRTDDTLGEDFAPVRVPTLKEDVYQEAKNLVDDLPAWTLVRADDEGLVLHCARKGGLLSGDAQVEITFEGPDGIPSCTVEVRSTSEGGLRGRDRANVAEFVRPFRRRVC